MKHASEIYNQIEIKDIDLLKVLNLIQRDLENAAFMSETKATVDISNFKVANYVVTHALISMGYSVSFKPSTPKRIITVSCKPLI